eukprot:CAMPEP_0170491586 /NCGR_PEP_ID=MMETSP0208-20121228/11133_1 /TAXON_ID=197538 /ORGANISM="Strombidium inclinatum, Strain S3" /LENGTH=48 /DNA_ID= /DNA_START= /DNA_END= /DNA_ORIENTATION=
MTNFHEFKKEEQAMARIHKYASKDRWRQEQCPIPEVIDSGVLFQLNSQ